MQNQPINLNELSKVVHQANIKWWQDVHTGQPIKRNKGELLMLVVTELAEACEGIRKNLMDDKLPHRKMEEVEMADAFIRLLDYAGGCGINLNVMTFDGKIPDNKCEFLLSVTASIVFAAGIRSEPFEPESWVSVALKSIQVYCTKFNLDLDGAIKDKMAFNATREDHKHEARRIAGGKQF